MGFRVLQEGRHGGLRQAIDAAAANAADSRATCRCTANGIDGTVEILLVEDNPADARLTREVFEDGRLSTHLNVVGDGEQALAFLRREGIYADRRRGRSSCCSTSTCRTRTGARCSRSSSPTPTLCRIPVIVLTTSAAESDIIALLRAAGELLHHQAARPRRVLHRRAVDQGLLAGDRAPAFELGPAMDVTTEQQPKTLSRSCWSRTTPATPGWSARCCPRRPRTRSSVMHVEQLADAREQADGVRAPAACCSISRCRTRTASRR